MSAGKEAVAYRDAATRRQESLMQQVGGALSETRSSNSALSRVLYLFVFIGVAARERVHFEGGARSMCSHLPGFICSGPHVYESNIEHNRVYDAYAAHMNSCKLFKTLIRMAWFYKMRVDLSK